MMKQGTLRGGSEELMAVELYAPFYLLLSISDEASGKEEKEKIAQVKLIHDVWRKLYI